MKTNKAKTRTCLVQYTVFDQLKERLLKGKLSKQAATESSPKALSAFNAFVLGAVSKCVATCLTYPAIRWVVNSIIPPCALHVLIHKLIFSASFPPKHADI